MTLPLVHGHDRGARVVRAIGGFAHRHRADRLAGLVDEATFTLCRLANPARIDESPA